MELKQRKQITNSHIQYDGTQPQSSSSFVNDGSLKQRKQVNNNLPKFDSGTPSLGGNIYNYISPLQLKYYNRTIPGPTQDMNPYGNSWMSAAQRYDTSNINTDFTPSYTLGQHIQNNGGNTSGGINKIDSSQKLMAGGQFARDAINFGMAVNNSFKGVKHEPELLGDAGQSNDQVMGIGYRRQNYIDRGAELKDLRRENVNNTLTTAATGAALGGSTAGLIGALGGLGAGTAAGTATAAGGAAAGAAAGAAGGSVVPIVGTAIGALVGVGIGLYAGSRRKKKLKRRIYDAQTLANQQNIYNRGAAMTAGLQQNYGLDYSDTQDDILYANRGKDLRQPIFR